VIDMLMNEHITLVGPRPGSTPTTAWRGRTIPPILVDTTRRLLHQLPGWEKLRIVQSRLTGSVSWQRALEKYQARHTGGAAKTRKKG
jgi:hypothetical protein